MGKKVVTGVMVPREFMAWKLRQGYSWSGAARHLGTGTSSLQMYGRGRRYDDDTPSPMPRHLILACICLEAMPKKRLVYEMKKWGIEENE